MIYNNIDCKTLKKEKSNKKKSSVCFSGYRPKKFDFPLDKQNENFNKMKKNLKSIIIDLIEKGYETFYIGMAEGFDIISGEILLECEEQFNKTLDIQCVLPYLDFFDNFSDDWKKRGSSLIDETNRVKIINMNYAQGVFYERNRFMVDNSSVLVCYYDGKKGGTKYTVDYAKKNNLEIINILDYVQYSQISLF